MAAEEECPDFFLRAPVYSTKKPTDLPNWSFPYLHRPIQLLSQASSSSLSSMPHQCGVALPHQSRRHLATALPSPNDRPYFPHASHAQPDPLSHKSRWDTSPLINRGGQLTLINVLVFTQTAQPWSFLSSHPLFGYKAITILPMFWTSLQGLHWNGFFS